MKKGWVYLYRAVVSQGNTLEFLLSLTRDAHAAKRFFSKALAAPHTSTPRVITVDKNAAYRKECKELKYEVINMLRKGQISGIEKGDSMKQVTLIASLFGLAA